jgi:hypothetical protein
VVVVGSPRVVVGTAVVVEGAIDVVVEVDVEDVRLVGGDVAMVALDDEVDASVPAPGAEQATTTNRPATLRRIGIPLARSAGRGYS